MSVFNFELLESRNNKNDGAIAAKTMFRPYSYPITRIWSATQHVQIQLLASDKSNIIMERTQKPIAKQITINLIACSFDKLSFKQ